MPACRECCGWMAAHENTELARNKWFKCRTCGYSAIFTEDDCSGTVSDFSTYLTSGVYPRIPKSDQEDLKPKT